MMPPMHDPIILRQPKTIDGIPVKDGRGFPDMNETSILARVVEESTLVLDTQGQEKQATKTVMMPPTVHPSLGDEVRVGIETLTIMKVKARKSYSGKKIYYWVTNCGE